MSTRIGGLTQVTPGLSDLATTLIPQAVALANRAAGHNHDIDAHRAAYESRRGP